jgi:hypothetical protein
MDITQRKAERYNWLLSQHDFLTEKIRQIKANNLEQTPQEEQQIKFFTEQQKKIMIEVQKLF